MLFKAVALSPEKIRELEACMGKETSDESLAEQEVTASISRAASEKLPGGDVKRNFSCLSLIAELCERFCIKYKGVPGRESATRKYMLLLEATFKKLAQKGKIKVDDPERLNGSVSLLQSSESAVTT